MTTDAKDEMQRIMRDVITACPIGVYTHRKGGEYVVFGHTVDEATLAPLIHYYSLTKQSWWTRTVANFLEVVDGSPRFVRKRDCVGAELWTAQRTFPKPIVEWCPT